MCTVAGHGHVNACCGITVSGMTKLLMCTLQVKPKSDGESAVSTKVSLLQQCLCCTAFQSIWQPSVDRVLPSTAQYTQDQDDSARGAAARPGGSSIVSEGGRP